MADPMKKAELLKEFTSKVDEFARYRQFIEKAESQRAKFAASVVEKVIASNEQKAMGVVEELIPLTMDVESVVSDLDEARRGVIAGAEDSKLQLEELELRQAIGELTDKEFASQTKDLKAQISASDTQVAGIDGELESFNGVLVRWADLGEKAGVLSAAPAPEPEPEPIPELEPEPEPELEPEIIEMEDDVLDIDGFEDAEPDGGVHAQSASMVDDLSDVFADDEPDVEILADEDDGMAIAAESADDDEIVGDEARRAVLLYQEGTAEEQIYPFTGDTLSLGRGRDNDIQVKNDSKVSRYHCKLYRRGPNFYIEDNKSANGTLVNGELITERRLFGGEEIIIGETFFRFRIMD
jgi:hypothetical protein